MKGVTEDGLCGFIATVARKGQRTRGGRGPRNMVDCQGNPVVAQMREEVVFNIVGEA